MALASGVGLISGLPVNDIIGQLLAVRQVPINSLQRRIDGFTTQQEAIIGIQNALLQLRSAAEELAAGSSFQARTATSGDETALGVTAASGAAVGSYAVQVLQLASSHRIGAQGFADTDTTGVAGADGFFKFKLGTTGTEFSIAVGAGTTLEDLRQAINASNTGVRASIINDGSASNPHRLVLSSDTTGAANRIIITQNDTALNFSSNSIEAAAAATGNTYAGTATSSGTYTGTASKRFVVEITEAGALGVAKFRVSEDGGATFGPANAFTTSWTATQIYQTGAGEGVQIAFGAGTFAVGDRFEIDTFAPEIQTAQDALFTVDGITLSRTTNTVTDAIEGVTFNLLTPTSGAVSASITSDIATVRGRIVTLVGQYNQVISRIAAATAFDPETSVRGPLLGDSLVRSVQGSLSQIVASTIPGLSNSEINSLGAIGITLNSDGTLAVNNATLDEALTDNLAAVEKLFATVGTTTNSRLSFISATADTRPGTYAISITQAAEQAQILSAQDITGPLTNQEVLKFTLGTTSYTVTVAAGSTLSQAVASINSQLQSQGVAITASEEGSRLRLATNAHGSEATFKVKSDQDGASATQLGIGTTELSDNGADVAGTIGGQAATGKGQTLTASEGSLAEGLNVLVTATTTGYVGDLTVSTGVGILFETELASLTDASTGALQGRLNGLSDSIEGLNEQIEKMQERISTEEARLRSQFAGLETLLAQFNQTSAFLTQQLTILSQLTISGTQ